MNYDKEIKTVAATQPISLIIDMDIIVNFDYFHKQESHLNSRIVEVIHILFAMRSLIVFIFILTVFHPTSEFILGQWKIYNRNFSENESQPDTNNNICMFLNGTAGPIVHFSTTESPQKGVNIILWQSEVSRQWRRVEIKFSIYASNWPQREIRIQNAEVRFYFHYFGSSKSFGQDQIILNHRSYTIIFKNQYVFAIMYGDEDIISLKVDQKLYNEKWDKIWLTFEISVVSLWLYCFKRNSLGKEGDQLYRGPKCSRYTVKCINIQLLNLLSVFVMLIWRQTRLFQYQQVVSIFLTPIN